MKRLTTILVILIVSGCEMANDQSTNDLFYLGADLSYVNEMLDCGAEFRLNGTVKDPYEIFGSQGANISRVRIWHSPEWTNGYSNFDDVALTIKRSKAAGMKVLLDFHYSDTWADPQHQVIPKAWQKITDLETLSDSLYQYTYQTLSSLHAQGLLPEMVQIGNEVNIEIMQDSASMVTDTVNWMRNITLLNAGLKAVEHFSEHQQVTIKRMIHIAQPENALWWFSLAKKYGIHEYEWIGLSYYPKWSVYSLDSLGLAIDSLIHTYKKDLIVVETAYPYTLENFDEGPNILGADALIDSYPATPEGQYNYMKSLIEITKKSGGRGVVYWEPAWVSTDCSTPWNKGSNWENATWFDAENGNEALPVFESLSMR